MKKRILSLVLTLAMVLSMFAGLTISASAANDLTLSFGFTSAPSGWPSGSSTSANSKTYTVNGTAYTFALGANVYYNTQKYLMLKATTYLGLPAIDGYKLTKVVAKNSSGCSTSTKVGVSSSASSASYISGGASQTWGTTSSTYTYTLSGTTGNTVYYLYVTNKNAQIIQLDLTYTPTDGPTHAHNYIWDGNPAVDGQHTLTCENTDGLCDALSKTEACTYVNGVCSVCGAIEPEKPKYELVTNASTLHAGDHILIVGVESGTYYALAPYVSGNNCRRNEVSAPVADVITTNVADITLGGEAGAWTLYDGAKYLYAAGGSSDNYLKGAANADADTAKWTISCAANGVATIKCVANIAKNWLRHNTSSDLFSCYSSGQADVSIYMKERPACEHLNKVPVTAKAPTCTEDGYTADGYYCPDCYTYIDTEVIAKLGHAWDEGTQTAAPTCQTVGTMTFTCTREGCGETKTEEIATVGHDLQWNEAVGEDGFHTLVCAFDCGYTEQAACTFDGATHLCTVCGAAAPACNITYSVPTNLEAPAAAEGVYNVTLPELPEADGYTALGWSVTAIPAGGTGTAPEVMEAGAEYQPLSDVTLYAVYSKSVDTGNTDYLKVTKTADLTDGQYLIVYETGPVAMNGAVDAVGNGISVEIVNSAIASDAATDAAAFTFSASTGSFRDASGKYIGRTASSNGLNISDTIEYENAVSIDGSGNAVISSASGCTMRYNKNSDQTRFRYYTSGQQAVQLYKKSDGIVKTYYTDFEASIHVCAENLTEHPAAAPGCETPGNDAYWECTCGKIYADANAETLLDAIPAIAALGHSYEYESNEDGTHNVTCTRCDYSASNVACVGELTEEGGVEMECSLCGYTWEVERFYQTSEIAEGDRIIIANGTKAIGSAASGTKLAAIDIVPANATLVPPEGVAILTVTDLAEGQFHLVAADGKYLTYPATGNGLSLADAPAVGATDYALWTIDGSVFKCVNAFYNNNQQALEYYTTFTTYGAGTGAAFQMTIFSDRQGCAHAETNLVGDVAETCLLPGYTGDYVCTECGTVITPGTVIPALGHNFVDGVCTNADCGATQLTAVNVTSLKDGATIYFYNASTGLALSNAAIVDGAKTQFAGVPGTVTENTLTTSSDAILFTVEVISGSGLTGQYKFKTADDLYLTYGDNRDTLTLAADSDHAIWAMDADYHISSVNSTYTFNNVLSPLYLEAYQGHFTCYNTSSLNAAFTIAFYDPSASDCDHQWGSGVEDPMHDCIHDGTITYTCSECGETKFDTVPADGVHHYDETTHICSGCGQVDPDSIDLSGNYYIVGTKATGEIYYMSAEGTESYRQADLQDDLTEIPASIDADVNENYVWTLTKNTADNTYTIKATYVDGDTYIGWTSGNSAQFVSAENAKELTVTQKDGITNINFAVDETNTRYFSFNAGSPRFAFYANTSQRPDLVLIPVTAEPVIETHTAVPTEAVAATCVAAGNVAYYTCQECEAAGEGTHYGKFYSDAALTEEIADVTLPIDSTNHVGYAAGETVSPTCTEQGYTVYTCSCGDSYNSDYQPALDHGYIYTDNKDGETHTVTCSRCDYSVSEEHTFVEGTCVCGATEGPAEPTYDGTLKFTMTAFSMGAELKFVFVMTKATATKYAYEYVDIVVDTADGEQTVRFELEDMVLYNNTIYRVEFTGIGAKMMGDTFTATIHAKDAQNNEFVGEPKSTSIANEILAVMRKSTATDVIKTLGADMLNYGAAAQTYFSYKTDSLVNVLMTEEEKGYATQKTPVVTNTQSKSGTADITVMMAAVTLGSKVTLNVAFNVGSYSGDKTKLTYKVTDVATGEVVASGPLVQQSGNIYKAVYDDVGAKRMRADVTIGVYNESDQLVSQVQTWSVESYIAGTMGQSTATQIIKNLLAAMIKYGDAAAAYLG